MVHMQRLYILLFSYFNTSGSLADPATQSAHRILSEVYGETEVGWKDVTQKQALEEPMLLTFSH